MQSTLPTLPRYHTFHSFPTTTLFTCALPDLSASPLFSAFMNKLGGPDAVARDGMAHQMAYFTKCALDDMHCDGGNALVYLACLFGSESTPDHKQAAFLLQEAADKARNPAAHIELAILYRYGWGVSRSVDMALQLLQRAVDMGDPTAHINLGIMYSCGMGVARDDKKAFSLYWKAKSVPVAKCYIAYALETGRGVKRDVLQAARCLQSIAPGRVPFAVGMLAMLRMRNAGHLEPAQQSIRRERSIEALERAADNDDEFSRAAMGDLYFYGIYGKDRDDALAYYHYSKANRISPGAMCNLGLMFFEGRYVAQNTETAISYLQASAFRGCYEAANSLSAIYMTMQPPDKLRSMDALDAAVSEGNPQSMNNLGVLLKQDSTSNTCYQAAEAVGLFTRAHEKGLIAATHNLAQSLYSGSGVASDAKRAFALFCQASDAGDVDALVLRGRMLYAGEGTAKNQTRAYEMFTQAAELGHPGARAYLKILDELAEGRMQSLIDEEAKSQAPKAKKKKKKKKSKKEGTEETAREREPADCATEEVDIDHTPMHAATLEPAQEEDRTQDQATKASHGEEHSACDDEGGDCCVVCLDQDATWAFVPCGHQCVCQTCAKAITDQCGGGKCPCCRADAIMTMQIYRQ